MFDLGPAAQRLRLLVSTVGDEQLRLPTPCSDWVVADLLAHVHQFSSVFTSNAAKQPAHPPASLVDDWRTAIPASLDELAEAWRDESAWHGTVSAGGVAMNAADNALVAVEEMTVHGWDLARATGRTIDPGEEQLDRVDAFLERFGSAPFADAVRPPANADRLERIIARTGRDARWTAPG